MERKLASIQRIKSLEPIEGADKIEKAIVLGWALVVKKGEFKVSDACVYIEIDSLLPEKEEFEFLRPRGFRIKTVRLRKQVSQGIAFPLSILPYGKDKTDLGNDLYNEGEDVTEVLGVKKYVAPIPANLSGKVKGTFPSFIPKTDETRIQTVPDVLIRHRGKRFYMTEKLDGSSMTVYLRDGEFSVCSRNRELYEDEKNSLWRVARELKLEEKLRKIGKNIALQGELIGNGIQKNKYKLKGMDFRIFNVFDIDAHRYLDYEEMADFVTIDLELQTVPFLGTWSLVDQTVDDLVQVSKGFSELERSQIREGLVFRSLREERDEELGRLSFKVINPDFLLKHDD